MRWLGACFGAPWTTSHGVWGVRLDSADVYRSLRRRRFGIEHLQLPRSLKLSRESGRLL